MRRATAAGLIADVLPDHDVLQRPDHPLLMDGPDFLAGRDGGLVAIMVARATERRSATHLAGRYALARLAYPPRTRWILLVDADVPWIAQMARNFHETIEVRSGSGHSLGERHIDEPRSEALSQVWERAAILEDVSEGSGDESERPSNDVFAVPEVAALLDASRFDWAAYVPPPDVGRSRWRPPGLALTQGGLIAFAPPERAAVSVQPYVRWLAERSFVLDNGAPYLVSDRVGLLATAAFDRRDPLKPARAAALAGWAVVPPVARRLQEAAHRLGNAAVRWRT